MKKYPFLLLLLAFVFAGCPHSGNTDVVKVHNDSDYSILAYIGDGIRDGGTIFPDTLLPVFNYTQGIPTKGVVNVGICANDYVRELYTDSQDTICFFLLDEKVVNANGWDVVYEDYNILARYDLSLDDMELLNFEISYPPRGEMKDMKMYPPYDTLKKATTDPTVSECLSYTK